MAKSAGKPGRSLTALAASMDTKKRPVPADARPVDARLLSAPSKDSSRDSNKERITSSLNSKPAASTEPKAPQAKPRVSAPRAAPTARTASASPAPQPRPRASAPRTAPTTSWSNTSKTTAPKGNPAPAATSGVVTRSVALSSLSRPPSAPAPSRFPAKPQVTAAADISRRKYPRAELHVRASLSLADDPSRTFEATLPTVNISVGGMFVESSFFLKTGTRLLVTLSLPPRGREVRVKAEVVRIETIATGESGFALRFTEYLDGSEVALATHFLSPVLREFITAYAKQHRFDASPEYISHTADVLAAWELKKAELGGDVWSLAGE